LMSSILAIGIVMLAGAAGGASAAAFGMSSVAGYVFAGLLVGQIWPGALAAVTPAGMATVAYLGLALIAFVVGGELEVSRLRVLPKGALAIALGQAVACVVLVTGVTVALGYGLELGMVLGAVAAATSPASTIMVTRRLRAGGPLTNALLSVVAINDAVCLLLFGVVISVARALPDWTISRSVAGMAGIVLWEVFGSILVGAVVGMAMAFFIRQVKGDDLVVVLAGAVILTAGLSDRMHTSPLIACVFFGLVAANLVVGSRRLFAAIDRFSAPMYILVLSLSGVAFDLRTLLSGLALLVGYILARTAGKVVGSGLAATLVRAEHRVGSTIGLSLLPQAGLAAGLVVAAGAALPEQSAMIASIVVPGVLAFEAIGLRAMRACLAKAGEARGGVRIS
jgi:Kef-type K+ transport system membrane component KefB